MIDLKLDMILIDFCVNSVITIEGNRPRIFQVKDRK
uniref:Uncharacterized protein n=1 Tax=Brugia timori TaxID=42155 RepID=A0A0R3QFW0_9BILA